MTVLLWLSAARAGLKPGEVRPKRALAPPAPDLPCGHWEWDTPSARAAHTLKAEPSLQPG